MPRGNGLCNAFDVVAVRDVAQLVLGAQLLGERTQPVLATRKQHELPAAARELAADRFADPAGCPGDDGYRQTRTLLAASIWRPAVSIATARRTCAPAGASCVPQEPV